MTHYHGKARNAPARTLEAPEKRRVHMHAWSVAAWIAVGTIAALALIFR